MKQLSILDAIQEGQQRAESGLLKAVDHADRETPGWADKCWLLFLEWLQRKPKGYRFLVEEFRLHLEAQNKIEVPPTKRAYGFLSRKAARENLIFQCGTGKVVNPDAHRANAARWEKI